MMITNRSTPWLRISQPKPGARLRLFCFPYAGGAASIYRLWPQGLPATIEVGAVQLPGRENRISEAPFTALGLLVEALLPHLRPYLDLPFACFGHSMGALLAYEVTRQLYAQTGLLPTHLLVSGRRAPFLPDPDPLLHTLPTDDGFLAALQKRYQNLPPLLLEDAELRQLFVPLLRADFTLVETYAWNEGPPLPCPLVALGGTDDPRATPAEFARLANVDQPPLCAAPLSWRSLLPQPPCSTPLADDWSTSDCVDGSPRSDAQKS